MYLPGTEVQVNGYLPATGVFTIGNVGSGASFQGEIYRPLYDRLKFAKPNAGTEDFDLGNLVIIPDWTDRIAVGRNVVDATINEIGEDAGSNDHSHTVDSHDHGVGGHDHSIPAHTHGVASDGSHSHGGVTSLISVRTGAAIIDASADVIDDHRHTISVDGSHNHGGATALSSSLTTGPGSGNTDPTSPGTDTVSHRNRVKVVYKIVKF
jgi:hypothetical protein